MNINVARVSGNNATKSIARFAVAALAAAGMTLAVAAPASATPEVNPPNIFSSPSGTTTSQTSASIQFAGQPDATFTCTLDSGSPQACTSPVSLSGLGEGSHTFSVTQTVMTDPGNPGDPGSPGSCTGEEASPTDCPGYVPPTPPTPATYATSPAASVTWTVDTTPPGVVEFSGGPAWGGLSNSSSASFGISAEGSSEIRCSLDYGVYTPRTSPLELTGLSEGFHSVFCIAFDEAGNASPSYTSRNWTVDTIAPTFGPQLYSYATSTSVGSSDLPSVTNSRVAFFQFYPSVSTEDEFICSLDGAAFEPCTSPLNFADLTEGSHTFSVKALDDAGNAGPATSNTWTIDLTAPNAPTLSGAPSSQTNSTSATITFTGEDGATFKCSIDGGPDEDCDGVAGVSRSGLADGSYSVRVKQTDTAGNTGPYATAEWTVDTVRPGNVVFSGTPAAGAVTNSTTTSLDVTSEGSSEIRCSVDAGPYTAVTSPVQLSGLAEGSRNLSCFGRDAAGNDSETAESRSWTVDTTAPAAPTLSGAPTSPTNSTGASISVSGEDEATFSCSVDGGPGEDCDDGDPVVLSDLADGPHSVSVTQTDVAGNTGPAAVATWTVDTTPPSVPVLSGAPSGLTNSTSAEVSFTLDEGATAVCSLDDGDFADCTSPVSRSGLGDGTRSVTVKAKDAAGNLSAPASASWTVDATAPSAPTLAGAPAAFTKATSAAITFTGEDGATFKCSIDGGPDEDCDGVAGVSRSELADGSYSVRVKQTDTAGNTGPYATAEWTVDNVAPNAPVLTGVPTGLVNQTGASISIAGEDGATFTCSVDGGEFSDCPSPKVLSGLADGNRSIEIKQADRAGNVSPGSSGSWEIDTVLPDVALGGVPAGESQGPTAGSFTNAKKPRWYFTQSDAADHLVASSTTCQVDNGTTLSNCSSPYQVPVNLGDGAHTLKINASDAAGNTRNFTVPFTIDTIAPIASITDGPSGRSGASVSFRIAANESNVTFRCRLAGANPVAWRDCDSDGDGVEDFAGLVSGSTTAYIQAIDPAGNQSVTVTRSWLVDASVPTATIRSRPATVTGSYPVGITRVDNGEFRFASDDPLATFECRIDSEPWAECETPYTFNSLVYGDHEFQVRAVNDVGTAGAAASFAWTYAGEPDTSIGTKPDANSYEFNPSFGFSSTYPGATFQCKLDGGSWGSCTSPKGYTLLSLLGHNFQVRAVNQLGEPDLTPASHSWNVVDIPNTAISTAAPAPTFDSAISVAFSSPYVGPAAGYPSAYPGATFQCSLDGGAYSACTSPKSYAGLTPGSHTVSVRAVNSAGAPDASPASITWTVKEAQTTIGTKPAAAITERDASFTFTSDAPSATFECKLDAGSWSACNSGSRSYSDLVLGSHTFQVRATKNGNTDSTPASYTFTVNTPDTEITAKPVTSVLSRSSSFSFRSPDTAGVTFQCKLDSGSWGSCTSPKRYSDVLPGSHTFQVRACKFGACDVSPASHTWTIRTAETTIGATKPASSTTDRDATFSFSSDLGSATFQCRLDGGSWGSCTSGKSYAGPLSIGSHTFEVRAFNGGSDAPDPTPASYTWTIVEPDTTITASPAAIRTGRTATFRFTSNADPATFECKLDGGAWVACTSPRSYTSPLSGGAHNFQVRAVTGGNAVDPTPASHDWTIIPPNTTITVKPSDPTTDRLPSFSFSSDTTGATFECKLDGLAWAPCTSPKAYSDLLASGSHTFQVRALNGLDLVDPTPATYTWTVNCPVLTQSIVLSSSFAAGALGAQVRTMSNGTSQLGNPWGFKLLLSGAGTDAAKLATFAGSYKRIDLVIKRTGATSSILRALTPGNNWESGFNPTEAGTYEITVKFVNKSGAATTRTVSITVNPSCS